MLGGTGEVVDDALVGTVVAGAVACPCDLVRDVRLCRRCVIQRCVGCKVDLQRCNLLSLQPERAFQV